MKLHVIIVALNNATMTREAVDSIQSKLPFTLHLIDQESKENFSELTDRQNTVYKRYSPRVSLSQAWNEGIIASLEDKNCEYILIPNNDVLFHKDTVNKLIEGIDSLGYAMVTGENLAPRYNNVQEFKDLVNVGDIEFDKRPITNWREEGPDFSCFMIKRDFVSKFGFFDETFFPAYCEDQDMHARIVLAGSHAKRLTTAPYYHFGSRTIVNNTEISGQVAQGHMANQVYYRKKWGSDHPNVLDRNGFQTPFDQDRPLHYWHGCEKYDKYCQIA